MFLLSQRCCVLFLFSAIFVLQTKEVTSQKLLVTVYYEVLCPDSIRFYTRQLYPTILKIGDRLDIDLIPYGKAIQNKDINGVWIFQCQHGPSECYGNKVHACILDAQISFALKLEIINCMFSSSSPSTSGRRCAAKSKVKYDQIFNCINTSQGDDLLAHYGDLTHALNPSLSFVPTITFNNTYDYAMQSEALKNMLDTTCDLFPDNDRPKGCNEQDLESPNSFVINGFVFNLPD